MRILRAMESMFGPEPVSTEYVSLFKKFLILESLYLDAKKFSSDPDAKVVLFDITYDLQEIGAKLWAIFRTLFLKADRDAEYDPGVSDRFKKTIKQGVDVFRQNPSSTVENMMQDLDIARDTVHQNPFLHPYAGVTQKEVDDLGELPYKTPGSLSELQMAYKQVKAGTSPMLSVR